MTFANLLLNAAILLIGLSHIPQVMRVLKTNQTKALSMPTYVMQSLGLLAAAVYGVLSKEPVFILSGAVAITLISVIMLCKLRNKD